MKFTLLFVLLICSSIYVEAQSPVLIQVGLQPLAIHKDADTIHVLCNGQDNNFNGIYEPDSGDIPATWWKLSAQTRSVLGVVPMTKGYFQFPLRAGFSKSYMYNPRQNTIEQYDLSTQELVDSAVVSLDDPQAMINGIAVLSTMQNGLDKEIGIVYSHKTNYTDPGYVSFKSLITNQLLFTMQVGINPQQILHYTSANGLPEFAVLCEGTFGGGNSQLHIISSPDQGSQTFKSTAIELGDTGNFITQSDGMILAVLNGSHEIAAIDVQEKIVIAKFPVGTNGYNGPREAVIDPESQRVFVTTYNSDVRIGALSNGQSEGILNSLGKPEGIAIIDNRLWVANAYKTDSYSYDSTIAIFPLQVNSVDDDAISENMILTKTEGELNVTLGDLMSDNLGSLSLIDCRGSVITTMLPTIIHGINGKVQIAGHFLLTDLPTGMYAIRYNSLKKKETALFIHRR